MRRFHEDKERLIRRLDLDPIQQDKLVRLFKQYPNLESKIDWNKKDLKWSDFQDVLSQAGKSKSQAQKKGLEGLQKGRDYEIVKETDEYVIYYPMTHLASKTLAGRKVAPAIEGKWCISTNDSGDWDNYVGMGIDFFFFFAKEEPEDGFPGEKYAIARYPEAMKQRLLPRLRMNHLPHNPNETLCEVFTENNTSVTESDYTVWPFRAYGWTKHDMDQWPSYFENPADWEDRARKALENDPHAQEYIRQHQNEDDD